MIIQLISKFPAVVEPANSSNYSTNWQLDSLPKLFGLTVMNFITTISAFYRKTLHYILYAFSLSCSHNHYLFNSQGVPHKEHKLISKFNQDANFFTIQLPHSFIHPFHPFILSSIHPFLHSPIHSSIHLFIHPFIHPFILSSIHLFIHPSIHSFFHPPIHSSINSFIHSFIMRRHLWSFIKHR
jgi:hypothetical protein